MGLINYKNKNDANCFCTAKFLIRLQTVLLNLRTFFKNSFAHSFHLRAENAYHLRTSVTFAHIFAPLPWPAAGKLLYQGMMNRISALLPLFTNLELKEFEQVFYSHLKVSF